MSTCPFGGSFRPQRFPVLHALAIAVFLWGGISVRATFAEGWYGTDIGYGTSLSTFQSGFRMATGGATMASWVLTGGAVTKGLSTVAAETAPKLLGPGTQFGAKIEGQLAKRGWTKDLVQSTIDNPSRTVLWVLGICLVVAQ